MIVITFANTGLSFWLNQDFAIHATRVLQLLAIGVFINSLGRVPYALIQAAGRPDICARLHLLELPLYLISLWYMLHGWDVEGAAFAWVLRIFLDNLALLISCTHIFPHLKSAMWRGIAMSILPCLVFAEEMLVAGVNEQITITAIAILIYVWSVYWLRQAWRGELLLTREI